MARKLKGKPKPKGLKAALLKQQYLNEDKKELKRKLENKKRNNLQPSKSVQKQKEAQRRQSKKFLPFNVETTLLLVGEGDFSFARSIITQGYIKGENLIATSYDSMEELHKKYPNSVKENIQFLISSNAKIIFNIDATNLPKTFGISKKNSISKILGATWKYKILNTIMFNFPHTGRGMKDQVRNIRDHQMLVDGFFKSSKDLFRVMNESKPTSSGLEDYSLGESSKPNKVVISLFNGEPYDSWGIKLLAKNNSWYNERSIQFDWLNYPGYHHKRTNNELDTTKPAEERKARMYIFTSQEITANKKSSANEESDND